MNKFYLASSLELLCYGAEGQGFESAVGQPGSEKLSLSTQQFSNLERLVG